MTTSRAAKRRNASSGATLRPAWTLRSSSPPVDFFRFPPEIRNTIYEYVALCSQKQSAPSATLASALSSAALAGESSLIPLAQTCRQIRMEYLEIHHKACCFDVPIEKLDKFSRNVVQPRGPNAAGKVQIILPPIPEERHHNYFSDFDILPAIKFVSNHPNYQLSFCRSSPSSSSASDPITSNQIQQILTQRHEADLKQITFNKSPQWKTWVKLGALGAAHVKFRDGPGFTFSSTKLRIVIRDRFGEMWMRAAPMQTIPLGFQREVGLEGLKLEFGVRY